MISLDEGKDIMVDPSPSPPIVYKRNVQNSVKNESGIFKRLRPKASDASTICTLSSDQKTTTIKEN